MYLVHRIHRVYKLQQTHGTRHQGNRHHGHHCSSRRCNSNKEGGETFQKTASSSTTRAFQRTTSTPISLIGSRSSSPYGATSDGNTTSSETPTATTTTIPPNPGEQRWFLFVLASDTGGQQSQQQPHCNCCCGALHTQSYPAGGITFSTMTTVAPSEKVNHFILLFILLCFVDKLIRLVNLTFSDKNMGITDKNCNGIVIEVSPIPLEHQLIPLMYNDQPIDCQESLKIIEEGSKFLRKKTSLVSPLTQHCCCGSAMAGGDDLYCRLGPILQGHVFLLKL